MLHITDTGLGMTHDDLVKNLGTIARSGTSEFLKKLMESNTQQQSDLIGQFGVGFYSSFLVADKVVVTSKHNDDVQVRFCSLTLFLNQCNTTLQHIWESDAASFAVAKDPRGNTLKRGTQITLHLKEEAYDYLEAHTIKELVRKYSQFINFNIYLWTSKVRTLTRALRSKRILSLL